jgi:D-tyrosyl-tRNA(Tyr) deacylase
MRAIIQRVSEASVSINTIIKSEIGRGLLIFVGIEDNDNDEDIQWLSRKISGLRIFSDSNGLMNLSLNDVQGELLVISQFTLHASTKKGNRPSYIRAAKPDTAIPLYHQFIEQLQRDAQQEVQTGEFGEMMDVSLINDGPVTIFIDTKNKE